MNRPCVLLVACYGAGLLLALCLTIPLTILFSAAFLLLLWAWFQSRWRTILLLSVLVFCGWINLLSRTLVLSPHDLRALIGKRFAIVTIRGVLVESPSLRSTREGDRTVKRTLARLDAGAVQLNGEWRPAEGRVAVGTSGFLKEEYFAGRQVEVEGVIGVPPAAEAPGLFDYRGYLHRQGIDYFLRVEKTADWQLLDNEETKTPPLSDRFRRWAQRTLSRGLPESDEALPLLWAMTLGRRDALDAQLREPFLRSGTMHIFAISGLHIALIAGVLVAMVRTLQVPRSACGLIVIPLLWFYAAATGWQASAIRSTVMMSLVIAGWSLKRPLDLINSLAAAALLILVWDPRQLFQAGFQLSFLVVLSIALFLMPLKKSLSGLWQPDPWLPPELQPRWLRWLRSILRWLLTGFATSLAAWLGSLPLTAYYFHLFTPISLVANLFILPLSSLALMSSLGSLVCGDWLPAVGDLFNHGAWFWMHSMMFVSEHAASVRAGWRYVAAPGPMFLAFYYSLLMGTLAGGLRLPRWRHGFIALLVVSGTAWLVESWRINAETRLTILPLDGGQAFFLEQPGAGNDWLIDTGNVFAAEHVTLPFLQSRGVNRLAHLAVTQGDVRLMGGAESVLQEFVPREIITGSTPSRSPYYRRFEAALASSGHERIQASRENTIGRFQVLHPDLSDHFARADDNALVLRGEFQGVRVLLLSELGREGQKALLARSDNLSADLVITGLPSKGEPLGNDLLRAIDPKLIVVVDSEFPATRRAPPALIQRLVGQNIPVLFTRETGSLVFRFKEGDWTVTTMKP